MKWFEPLIIIESLDGDCGCNGNCKKCGHQCSSCDKLLKEYRETCSKE